MVHLKHTNIPCLNLICHGCSQYIGITYCCDTEATGKKVLGHFDHVDLETNSSPSRMDSAKTKVANFIVTVTCSQFVYGDFGA